MGAIRGCAAILITGAVAAGCGGRTSAQVQGCWQAALRTEVARLDPQDAGKAFTAKFTTGLPGKVPAKTALAGSVDALARADQGLLVTSADAYATRQELPSWLPSYVRPWLRSTESKCGRLR